MQYRPFGKLDFQVSALGFGAMRFPTKDGKIDETEAAKILHAAIDQGVNYVDTAYPYHDGTSETFLGRVLQGSYRQKVRLATKMPSWLMESAADFDKYFETQLKRLQRKDVDFYLLHALNKKSWLKLRDLGVLDWAEKATRAGRFRHFGFSFHDGPEVFRSIIDDYDRWDMCQIQYNYMDVANQAGMEGLRYAAAKGIAVVVMEPLLGGKLTAPPQPIQEIWDQAANQRSAVEWALQWLWDQPEVSTVLSGMSAMEQVVENVALARKSGIGLLNREEQALVDNVRVEYRKLTAISCTNCRYCMPCPNHIDIPANFANYNDGIAYGKPDNSRGQYSWWKTAHELKIEEHDIRAGRCLQCGLCDAKCPQGIPISRWMPVIHKILGEGDAFVLKL
jgi:predicted aldo/keto reductase-like oxidoreductase